MQKISCIYNIFTDLLTKKNFSFLAANKDAEDHLIYEDLKVKAGLQNVNNTIKPIQTNIYYL